MRSGIFFERDGVLNLPRLEGRAQVLPSSLEQMDLNRKAIKQLRELSAAGFALFATTNQPGISRGTLCRRELDRMHDFMRQVFPLAAILVCPHEASDDCTCRKPHPGLLQEAAFKYHLDLQRSYVVSDKWQDAKSAQVVGATSILIRSPWNGTGHHDFVLNDLGALSAKIQQLHSSTVLAMNQV